MGQKDPETILRGEVDRGVAAYLRASRRFLKILSSLESGPPGKEDGERMEAAAEERRAAIHNLAVAVHRLEDYVFKGRLPDDLGGIGQKPN